MKRVLINWYYDRQDLTHHLLDLADEVQITFLQWFQPPEGGEPAYLDDQPVNIIYWGDFDSPYEILQRIMPDLLIFSDIEAFNQLALNIAARNSGIITYVLQHGLRGEFEVEDAVRSTIPVSASLSGTSWWTMKFLFRSLRWKNSKDLKKLMRFIWDRKRLELTLALYKNKFELRRADYYIEFSKNNAGYHKIRDGIEDKRFIIIGNPAFDEFHIKVRQFHQLGTYALLIDCPFCEANFLKRERMTIEEKNAYISVLNNYCKSKGLKLAVKLHPLSYKADNLFLDDNIEYHREADLVQLIGKADFVLAVHFSTLLPHLLIYKPFLLFHSEYIGHSDMLTSLPVRVHNLENLKEDDLIGITPSFPLNQSSIEEYVFLADGKASSRLRNIILSDAYHETS